MSRHDLSAIPGIHTEEGQPVFSEPWEAQAFALVVGLHEKGLFEWSEWADVLSGAISEADDDIPYYQLWLRALERIVASQELVLDKELLQREEDWRQALLQTPHGQPIELKPRGV